MENVSSPNTPLPWLPAVLCRAGSQHQTCEACGIRSARTLSQNKTAEKQQVVFAESTVVRQSF